jgi:hypothetical protein
MENQTLKRYLAILKHDRGIHKTIVLSFSLAAAKQSICRRELCPMRSIISIEEI